MNDDKLYELNNAIAKIWLDAGDQLKDLLAPLSDDEVIALAEHWEKQKDLEITKNELPGGYWNFLNKIRVEYAVRQICKEAGEYMKMHPEAKCYCPFHKSHDCWDLHDE